MISRTLRVTMDGWPQGAIERRTVVMPVRPADALVAVRVFDRAGEAEVVTGRFTLARGRSARLVWTNGAFPWPGQRYNGIEVDYVAGFGAAIDVPSDLKRGVLALVAHWFEHRDAVMVAGSGAVIPPGFGQMISPYRQVRL